VKPSISDESVQRATGKTWSRWFSLIDRAGGKTKTHQEIVVIAKKNGAGPWWQQMVTVTYEQVRKGRKKHQMTKGYAISLSKTLPISKSKLFTLWKSPRQRAAWFPKGRYQTKKIRAGKLVRLGSSTGAIEILFISKDSRASRLMITHSKLSSAGQAARYKKIWQRSITRVTLIAARTR
jgi:hypothetical protein